MIDVIGTLYATKVATAADAANTPAPAMNEVEVTPLAGWHVNSSSIQPEWEAYRVEPKTPSRVIFGAATYYYSFPDMETAKALINMENYNAI